jgi:hypothetical protein
VSRAQLARLDLLGSDFVNDGEPHFPRTRQVEFADRPPGLLARGDRMHFPGENTEEIISD